MQIELNKNYYVYNIKYFKNYDRVKEAKIIEYA